MKSSILFAGLMAAMIPTSAIFAETSSIPSPSAPLRIQSDKWNYDEANDIFYQIGLVYCAAPKAAEYESLAIYVPGQFMSATKNSDGTYTAKINPKAKVGKFTAKTAPIVMPVNTGGYAAQKAPTAYYSNGLSTYLSKGMIYVYAGCRGRDNGTNPDGTSFDGSAPWGVTDLKAAVRYLRYNNDLFPGSTDKIFTFGHSGGGAQSALMGASGDSNLYQPYLSSIGAIMTENKGNPVSDAIYGAMCWCPITSLPAADLAYEWMMGQYSADDTRAFGTWTRSFSKDMARAFPDMLSRMDLHDEHGNLLTLAPGGNGIYASGTYYTYLKGIIEESLSNYLSDNTFPLTTGKNDFQLDGGFPGEAPRTSFKPISPSGKPMVMQKEEPHTFATKADYISYLNKNKNWVSVDETGNVSITSIEDFVTTMKKPSKAVGAFDDLHLEQAENRLFGTGFANALHFDGAMAYLLKEDAEKYKGYADFDSSIPVAYLSEMDNKDRLGIPTAVRQAMYDPMFYLLDTGTAPASKVAPHWRIHTGISQGDTSLTTEVNLMLALKARSDVKDVDFATVWEAKHTKAERTGNSTDNFIAWVESCSL